MPSDSTTRELRKFVFRLSGISKLTRLDSVHMWVDFKLSWVKALSSWAELGKTQAWAFILTQFELNRASSRTRTIAMDAVYYTEILHAFLHAAFSYIHNIHILLQKCPHFSLCRKYGMGYPLYIGYVVCIHCIDHKNWTTWHNNNSQSNYCFPLDIFSILSLFCKPHKHT